MLSRDPTGREADEPQGPGLREIAERLTTPARSGIVLTKQQLGQIGAGLSLPVGMAERSQMLMNLFRAAAEVEMLPPLIGALRREVERWEASYEAWAVEYPRSTPIWNEWRERLTASRELLVEMASLVETRASGDEASAGPENP